MSAKNRKASPRLPPFVSLLPRRGSSPPLHAWRLYLSFHHRRAPSLPSLPSPSTTFSLPGFTSLMRRLPPPTPRPCRIAFRGVSTKSKRPSRDTNRKRSTFLQSANVSCVKMFCPPSLFFSFFLKRLYYSSEYLAVKCIAHNFERFITDMLLRIRCTTNVTKRYKTRDE